MPACMAATCAFMLPVATPPNAVVFAYGHLTVLDMVGHGSDLLVTFNQLWKVKVTANNS